VDPGANPHRIEGARAGTNRSLTLRLAALAAAMFGFGFLLVPLYDVFCQITGVGGRTEDVAAGAPTAIDASRRVTVEFVATVNEYAPWEFRPAVTRLEVEPGRLYDVTFHARNLTGHRLTGQAIPSVAPGRGARYLRKTECFCFRSQEFAPEEARELTVQFYVDPALPGYLDRLTLSYTMFVQPDSAPEKVSALFPEPLHRGSTGTKGPDAVPAPSAT
jgi:cytochrome c oxidase assembly protein subunit 11